MKHEEQGPQSEPERLEALVCAYVLGEADADERREVEEALAVSAELRAHRDELERTIGCVRETFDERERMSDAATSALLKRVEDRPRLVAETPEAGETLPAWTRSPYWRTAAALLFVVGISVVYRAGRGGEVPEVAQRERAPEPQVFEDQGEEDAFAFRAREFARPELEDSVVALSDEPRVTFFAPSVTDSEEAPSESVPEITLEDLNGFGSSVDPAYLALEPSERLYALGYADEDADGGAPSSSTAVVESADVALAGGAAPAVSIEPKVENALGEMPGALELRDEIMPVTEPAFDGKVFVAERKQPMVGRGVTGAPVLGAELRRMEVLNGQAEPSADTIAAMTPGLGAVPSEVDAGELTLSGFDLPEYANAVTFEAGPGSPGPPNSPGPPARAGASPTVTGYDVEIAQGSALALGLQPAGGKGRGRVGFRAYATERKKASEVAASDDFFLGRGEAEVRAKIVRADDFYFGQPMQRPLTAEESKAWFDQLFQSCRRLPQEQPRDMFFRFWGDNPFELSTKDALSTFSVDVDSASYTLARKLLNEGHLPPKAQVRTEEFLNYFEPDVAAPVESTFKIETELAPARFGSPLEGDLWNLRVALRGRELAPTERKPLALTFVVDVSGSMEEEGRLELVKHALRLLLAQLDANDSIALIAFSQEARLVLPPTSARARGVIESAIHPLSPDGGTNAEAGLKMGYEVAAAGFVEGSENRVVFLSDGVANIGQTDQDRIGQDVEHRRDLGIYLNTIGVGLENHNDVFLEQLADRGDGKCDYIDSPRAAERALVENFVGNFQAIARDVKIQVEFDPRQVWKYRLLGYENRAIRDSDFRNDAVDAGEVGSGHQVVALYEVALHSIVDPRSGVDAEGEVSLPLANVHVRWKRPHGEPEPDRVTEVQHEVRFGDASADFEQTSPGFRRSVLVAQFAEFLRRSVHARGDSLGELVEECEFLAEEISTDEMREFAGLVKQSRALVAAELGRYGQLDRAVDLYRKNCWMLEERRDSGSLTAERLLQMEKLNQDMEEQLRELLLEELDR